MNNPLVTVCLITYNHEKYIRQAIEGVIMQRADFQYKLVIADDFSTDKTRQIILGFKNEHPELIDLIFQEKNVGPAKNWKDLISYPQSKYIAYFEGDDYWTDPMKLQKQFNFLEQNKDFSAVAHNVRTKSGSEWLTNHKAVKEYFIQDFFHSSCVNSVSLMYRNNIELPDWVYTVAFGDWAFFVTLVENGRFGFLEDEMAVYRLHAKGVYSGLENEQQIDRTLDFLHTLQENLPLYRTEIGEVIDSKKKYYGRYDYSLKALIKGNSSVSVFLYGIRSKLNFKKRLSKLFSR